MTEKYITIDIEDPRAAKIAEVISNKTAKRILTAIAEKEMSESEIARELGIPLNTTGYNVKKLADSGLIEKVNRFFWSSRGKRINTYRISDKKIVISPKMITKGIIPAVLGSSIVAFGIKVFVDNANKIDYAAEKSAASSTVASEMSRATANYPEAWAWFLLGALITLLIILVWNWRKR